MNCKEGDLAVVIRNDYGEAGKIVTCIRLAGQNDLVQHNVRDPAEPVWVIDFHLKNSRSRAPLARDCSLRPIRDQTGEDESLVWKDVPQKVVA